VPVSSKCWAETCKPRATTQSLQTVHPAPKLLETLQPTWNLKVLPLAHPSKKNMGEGTDSQEGPPRGFLIRNKYQKNLPLNQRLTPGPPCTCWFIPCVCLFFNKHSYCIKWPQSLDLCLWMSPPWKILRHGWSSQFIPRFPNLEQGDQSTSSTWRFSKFYLFVPLGFENALWKLHDFFFFLPFPLLTHLFGKYL
jgi:hypothetical protein